MNRRYTAAGAGRGDHFQIRSRNRSRSGAAWNERSVRGSVRTGRDGNQVTIMSRGSEWRVSGMSHETTFLERANELNYRMKQKVSSLLNYTVPKHVFNRGVSPDELDERGRSRDVFSDRPSVPTYAYHPRPPDRIDRFTLEYGPFLTRRDVDDFGEVDFVADPFLWNDGQGTWHVFFEVYNESREPDAAIGHATSTNLLDWTYNQIVFETDLHVSFPYVFKWQNEYYMVPERVDNKVVLLKAKRFPTEWERVTVPVSHHAVTNDAVVFRWDDRWWIAVNCTDDGENLYLYHAADLETADWTPHELNPVLSDRPDATRPAGRPVVLEDSIIFFYQDCSTIYGESVSQYRITELSESTFEDQPVGSNPLLAPTGGSVGWNSGRMHHIDPWWTGDEWICAVDGNVVDSGYFTYHNWSIGIHVGQ